MGPPSEARLAVAASANVVPVLERALAAALASWAIEVRGDERGGPSRTARGDWIMAAVRDADPLSVSAVCRSLGCGRTWLWRTCARELGCHPAELLEAGDWVLGTASPAPVEMLEGERRFFSCTFRLRWFRVRIHLSTPGAKPILTCWAEGLLRSGGHGVWGEPAPAAGGGGVLAGSIDPTRPRGAGAAAVSGGKRYTDSMAYRLGQMPPLPPGPGGGIPGVDITTTAHHQAALQAHDQNLVFPDGVKAPEEPPEAGFVPGGAAPPDGLPEGALWMGKPVAPPPREEP